MSVNKEAKRIEPNGLGIAEVQEIESRQPRQLKPNLDFNVDVSGFSTGMYLIQVTDGEQIFNSKFKAVDEKAYTKI